MTTEAVADQDAPAVAPAASGRVRRAGDRLLQHVREQRIPYVVAVLTFLAYLVLSVRLWQRYTVPSWDLGIFDQAIRTMAAGHAPVVLIKGVGFNVFGDHFHPVIALLVPVYWIAPSAVSLLVVQDLLVAVSAFVVTRAAVGIAGGYGGAALGLAYAGSWGLQTAVAVQFHEVAFALPLLAASLAALVARRWTAAVAWAAPLVFVKEDLGLTVLVLGLLVVLRSRGTKAALGGALAAWGVVWFLLAVKVVLPAFNRQGVWDYGSQITWSTVTDPAGLANHLLHPAEKLQTVAFVLGITGFLALRSSIVLAVLPTFAWRFLSDTEAYWGRQWHYSAVLMPIVFLALLDAVERLTDRRSRAPAALRAYAGVAAPVCATIAVLLTVQAQPLRDLARPDFYRPRARDASARQVLATVPAGTSVESDAGLIPYLTDDHDVYWMGRSGNPPPDYLLIDRQGGGWGSESPGDVPAYATSLHPGTRWTVVFDRDDYVLVARVP